MYPSFLPLPTRENYTAGSSVQLRRRQMEDNKYTQRRIWDREIFNYALTWRLTWEQAQMFEGWIEYDLIQGTGYAEIPIGSNIVKVRPVGDPVFTPLGHKWQVKMLVEELKEAPLIPPRTGVLPNWPETLPEFERSEYQYSKADDITRSDIADQFAELRVRFQDRTSRCTGKVLLDPQQREEFWSFYTNTLISGHAYFSIDFPTVNGYKKVKARIYEKPSETPNGSWYSVYLKLETSNLPMISFTEYAIRRGFVNDYVEDDYVEPGYVGYFL